MRGILRLAITALLLGIGGAQAADDVMIVFDGSNSMWGQIDGEAKITIARDVMGNLTGDWTEDTNLGLMAYGHRRRGDCMDIETIVPLGKGNRDMILEKIGEITPRGKTPLTTAIERAAETLSYRDNPATVILISDGIESCQRDPCATAETLERKGVAFTAHVIGFGIENKEDQQSLACIADSTGGRFLAAGDAAQLGDALSEVSTAVAETPKEPPEPVSVELDAPETAEAGTDFEVRWNRTPDPTDRIVIVPAGAADDAAVAFMEAGDATTGTFTAPDQPGRYDVRYILAETGKSAGSDTIEITGPEVDVTAPESAPAGSKVDVGWSESLNNRDYVTIVPAGTGKSDNWGHEYDRVGGDSSTTLTVPSDPGLYELRYVLNAGDKTLASAPIEVTEPEVTVSGPESAATGSGVQVEWSASINGRDYVTIVPAGTGEGDNWGHEYDRVGGDSSTTLTVPSAPGLYELRYVLNAGDKTLASAPIEVTEPEVTLSGPESATAGSKVEIEWSASINGRDYVTIVPAGTGEGDNWGHEYDRVGGDSSTTLTAPSDPGLYELRYVLNAGDKTLASAPIELTEPDVSVSAPETIRVGDPLKVSWEGDIPNRRDYVTIVPTGASDKNRGDYVRVGGDYSTRLDTPKTPGLYEVRYVLNAGDRVLARAQVEIVTADTTLNQGGTLEAPATGAPGASVDVSWSVATPNRRQRVALAQTDQASFTWITAKAVSEESTLTFALPEDPGTYEFRLLDLAEQAVLSRATIEVR